MSAWVGAGEPFPAAGEAFLVEPGASAAIGLDVGLDQAQFGEQIQAAQQRAHSQAGLLGEPGQRPGTAAGRRGPPQLSEQGGDIRVQLVGGGAVGHGSRAGTGRASISDGGEPGGRIGGFFCSGRRGRPRMGG
ncbi:hypothetical protein CV_1623 [Chromobacterium violaceum ATCC 12472]|uniref:Uncharacterized protein n=1 Tax=Chromobacterium violaceum (strain ATCC 12472 / DSM 30191 / JCM 1249 / CCUG 213 / NBRC 12614 / NCIMB 9131 / NCTC 9757 / MK) TaxID=243365 RepID=Q7NXK3_CHRVO|nr:hypothetical protein CV_1623 [Chromobacterium violaceum ATCC 12472]